jgi:hypothetical protein
MVGVAYLEMPLPVQVIMPVTLVVSVVVVLILFVKAPHRTCNLVMVRL